MTVNKLIQALPKAELHIHLLGAVRPSTLLEIIDKSGSQITLHTTEDIENFFQFRDFQHFIEVYMTIVGLVREEEYFDSMTYEMLEECHRQNIKYVELSFSPLDHMQFGLDFNEMLNKIHRARKRGRNKLGILSDVRIDLVRSNNTDTAMQILDLIEEASSGIVSIDIGGNETKFPPAPYAPVYERARDMGLHLVAHAGEAAGPQSIWDAVDILGVERVGHGVSARGDRRLLQHLLEKRVVIEACPVSNVRTRVVPDISSHPVREFFDCGLTVTVNSDDPSLFNTNLTNEYLHLHEHLGFTVEELHMLSVNAVNSAFIPESTRDSLLKTLQSEYEHLTR
jgi:adenosine deaminase